jgi:putative FmdB family regulatory protein
MPTYAYACKQCGHRFDAVQSFADPALSECPECGGPLRKEYGSIGVTFNGSGFYRTDSRAATGGASAPASTSSKSEATASPATSGT